MRVLVTRPEPGASELRARLEQLGHTVTLAPLMHVELFALEANVVAGAQALIATSRNALQALAQSPALPQALGRPLFAVGPSTAEAGRGMGFAHVVEGPGSARELLPVILAKADPAAGPLVHLAGAQLAFDLAGALAGAGFRVAAPVVYGTRPVAALPCAVGEELRARTLDAVTLLSPETARTWARLVAAAGLADSARSLRHVCFSRGVAAALSPLAPADVRIAARPTLEEMLALLVE
jgi:uroporphyrinogen-III synthase